MNKLLSSLVKLLKRYKSSRVSTTITEISAKLIEKRKTNCEYLKTFSFGFIEKNPRARTISRPKLRIDNLKIYITMEHSAQSKSASNQCMLSESNMDKNEHGTDDRSNVSLKSSEPEENNSNLQLHTKSTVSTKIFDSNYGDGLSKRASKAIKRKKSLKVKSDQAKKHNNKGQKNPGYGEEILDETDYYFENGLRKVYPYYFNFSTYAKRRWLGRTLMDVFTDEFHYKSSEDYKQAILNGEILVNKKTVPCDYKLQESDHIENTIHRHETGVIPVPMKIIEANEDIVVVDKPSSMPVHPCGRYRHNSVVFILAKEYGYKNLRTIYRLDRLTSGVLIFGASEKRSLELENQVRDREVEKEYVCRVEGKFPDGIIVCDKPIDVLSPKLGLYQVMDKGKESSTTFERISYSGNSSVVRCIPKTGRTHQIRVHLQWLGYPIINDPLYNSTVWGDSKGKLGNYGKSRDHLITDIQAHHQREKWAEMNLQTDDASEEFGESIAKKPKLENVSPPNRFLVSPHLKEYDHSKVTYDKNCYDCKLKYKDPNPDELIMYLHAVRYKGPGWEYETDLPAWANENWVN